MKIRDVLELVPVIPVLTLHDVKHAVPLAEALCAGGLRVIEVTLRTSIGLAVIEAMRRLVPTAIVGVGTLTRPEEFAMAARAGAQFGVSPGLTPELAAAARSVTFPFLPGVMTPSDLIRARGAGYDTVRFFPAAQAGGIPMLQALSGPFPDVTFCPSGGISSSTAHSYLALPNVICVGGSWLTPHKLIENADWKGIEQRARDACLLRN